MPLIRPFAGLRPAPGLAADVAAPPYDVLSTEEARLRAAGKPWSFLHISKPEIDLPRNVDPYDQRVYRTGARNLQRMCEAGVLRRDAVPSYYLYRLQMGEHIQTGLVAVASVAAYEHGRIHKHEFTRPDKEDDRVRQIDALNAQTGPVLLAHRGCAVFERVVAKWATQTPVVDIVADNRIRHTLWVISDPDAISRITEAFTPARGGEVADLYIADGHHRTAAAARVAQMRRSQLALHTGDEAFEWFLAVIFPADRMRILDYNRVVRDLNGMNLDAYLAAVSQRFALTPVHGEVCPSTPGQFGMYLPGQWYLLEFARDRVPADPVASLDVSLLHNELIEPVLGISDPRSDARIDFVGGIRGLGELVRRVDGGEMAVAFALHPTAMAQLMAVADADRVMPPKSTWFEPKLADGLVSHVLD